MIGYKEVKFVEGARLVAHTNEWVRTGAGRWLKGPDNPPPEIRASNEANEELNELLAFGWVIISVIPHTSTALDMTGIFFVLGLPE